MQDWFRCNLKNKENKLPMRRKIFDTALCIARMHTYV